MDLKLIGRKNLISQNKYYQINNYNVQQLYTSYLMDSETIYMGAMTGFISNNKIYLDNYPNITKPKEKSIYNLRNVFTGAQFVQSGGNNINIVDDNGNIYEGINNKNADINNIKQLVSSNTVRCALSNDGKLYAKGRAYMWGDEIRKSNYTIITKDGNEEFNNIDKVFAIRNGYGCVFTTKENEIYWGGRSAYVAILGIKGAEATLGGGNRTTYPEKVENEIINSIVDKIKDIKFNFINEAGRPINDVILMYFIEGFCEDSVGDPDVYLRQSMDSLYVPGTVGISNLKSEITDAGYKVEDLMYCNKVLGDSYACNVYRTDTVDELNIILNNKRTRMTLEDLYDHAGYMDYNTDPKSAGISDEEVYYKGYCKNLITLLDRSGFINDIYSSMGMTEVDFVIKEGVDTITGDDKILLSLLYGGIRINKTFATKWDYTQDLEEVKTKYMLVVDSDKKVYIVGYTESEEEWSTELKAQQLEHLSERLMHCAKVYDNEEDSMSSLPFFEDPSSISTISEDGNENG